VFRLARPTVAPGLWARVVSTLVPGTRSASVIADRFATGSVSISCGVTVSPTSVFVVSTMGVWACTVTNSWTPCRPRVTLRVNSRPTVIVRSFTAAVEKPCNSAVRS